MEVLMSAWKHEVEWYRAGFYIFRLYCPFRIVGTEDFLHYRKERINTEILTWRMENEELRKV